MKNVIFASLLAFSMMGITTACTNSSSTGMAASTPPCGSGKCAGGGKCGGPGKCGSAGKCGSPTGGAWIK